MRKRVLSMMLVLCMMLSLLPWTVPMASASETVGSRDIGINAKWDLMFDGGNYKIYSYSHTPEYSDVRLWFVPETGTISGAAFGPSQFGAPDETYHLTIPKTLGGVDVTKVSSLCYDVATSKINLLSSLTVPNSVQSLGGCNDAINLTSVTFLGPIELVANAFTSCTSLENVTWKYITSIGGAAFSGCSSLKHVDLPEGIILDDSVFSQCKSLTNVTLPSSLTVIPSSTFEGSGLSSIILNNGCTSISSMAFAGCENLTDVKLNNGLIEIGSFAFEGCSNLIKVDIPSSVERIGDSAFMECSKLANITLPKRDNLKIGEKAFQNSGLTSITIPTYTTSIGGYCFSGCDKITWVSLPNPNNRVFMVVYAAFDGCAALTDVYFDGSQEEWSLIHIFDDNDPLKNATIHYNSTGPSGNPPINPDDLSISVDVESKSYPIKPDNTVPFNIKAEVTNTGNDTITDLFGTLVFDSNNSNFIVYVLKTPPVNLAPGASTTFEWNGYVENSSDTTMEGQYTLSFECTDGQLYSKQHTIPVVLGDGKTHTVTFDLNGGSGTIAPQVVHDRGHVSKPTDPTRSGYTFNGWYTEKIDTLTDGSKRLTWTDWYGNILNGKPVTEDITLHAGWLSNELIYGKDTFNFENVPYDFYGVYDNPKKNGYSMRTDYLNILHNQNILTNTEIELIDNMVSSKWYGSCFGMSSVIALIKAGKLDVEYFQNGASLTYDLDAPKDNETVRSLINYYATMQKTGITELRFKDSSLPQKLNQIILSLNSSQYPVIVEFDIVSYVSEQDMLNANCSPKGTKFSAHAVLAYDYSIDPETGDYIVSIWDPATKTAPYSCDLFSVLRIKKDFSNATFENFSSYGAYYDDHITDHGVEYWRKSYVKSSLTVESGLYDFLNLETALKRLGYVHGYDSGPTQTQTSTTSMIKNVSAYSMSRSTPESGYVLYTNYPSFTITCSDGTNATVTNGYATGTLQISDALILNDIGCELYTAYFLPQLTSEKSYEIVPTQSNSNVTGQLLTNYSTTLITSSDSIDSSSGIYTAVDMEGTGTITIFGDAKTSTSFATPTKHSIDVVRNDAETPWYSTTATATAKGMTVTPTSTDAKISATDDVPVQITLGNSYNEINFNPVNVDSDGVKVLESPDSKGTVIIVKGDDEVKRDAMTYTVIFYPMNGSSMDSLNGVVHSSTISKPANPTWTGHTFEGWYVDPEYKTAWSFDTPITEDIRLFAKWTESSSNPSKPSNPGSSSSSSSGDNDPSYSISVPSGLTGGKISVTPTRASAGQRVTITVTPDKDYELDSLTVIDSKGNELVLTDKGAGKYTFNMPTGKATINATFKASQPFASIWNNPFVDVAENAWYYDAVRFVNQQGLMNGTSSNTFSPDSKLTRAQLAQVLYNKNGRPYVNSTSTFTDVVADAWYADAITWATSKGIISGYGNGMVGPNDFITREQLATILWRYENSPISNYELQFTDTDHISQYALNALRWAAENGIMNGYSDGRLSPSGNANRSHVAQMLKNCFSK